MTFKGKLSLVKTFCHLPSDISGAINFYPGYNYPLYAIVVLTHFSFCGMQNVHVDVALLM